MKTADAIKYFGGKHELAAALGIWPHNIPRWGVNVPILRAYQIEKMTGGVLKAKVR